MTETNWRHGRKGPTRQAKRGSMEGAHVSDVTRQLIGQIVDARFDVGMTQKEFADTFGIHQSVVSDFENCYSEPSVGKLARYAEAVGLQLALVTKERTA